MTVRMCMLRRDSAEWRAAWMKLADADGRLRGWRFRGQQASEHPECGERWQLMGTVQEDGRWAHEFRHRCHPATQKREYVHIPASNGWTPEKEGITE